LPRIGFDAVRALRNSTGLGNYGRRVLRGLLGGHRAITGRLYSPAPPRPEYAELPQQLGSGLSLPPAPWRAPVARSLWRTYRLGRQAVADGVELYHGLSHEIPRDLPGTGLPSVVSFLDLLWLRYPEFYPAIDRLSYQWRYRWSAEHASAIVAASRQTRRDLLERYGVSPARIVVIPPPADGRFGQPVTAAARRSVLAQHALPERFLLSVGTLEARKDQRTAIAALAKLDPARTPPLVLIGRDGGARRPLLRLAARLGVAGRVLIRSGVRDAELPALMPSATLFLYPSLFEGFGLPIVEALAAGVPVIASEGGCFPEAGGPDSRYFPAGDADALADQMRQVLDDAALADRMRVAGRSYAKRFDPQALADRLLAVYDAVLHGRALPADGSSENGEERNGCAG
jgi:glycosyltransferase involved in cell wall biosynthesis